MAALMDPSSGMLLSLTCSSVLGGDREVVANFNDCEGTGVTIVYSPKRTARRQEEERGELRAAPHERGHLDEVVARGGQAQA